MPPKDPNYSAARHDFSHARAQASMQGVLAHLTGRSNELLSYEEVADQLKLNLRSERGVLEIPLKSIVGSVGRYTDFTRTFLPLSDTDMERWVRVKAAIDAGIKLAPIDVYKVGAVYFVLDGNHRVSVARQKGLTHIQAHVIEVKTDALLDESETVLDALIVKSEYADFLERTDILRLRPGINLLVTIPGQYEKMLEHIQVHQYFMGIDLNHEVSYAEALSHWYDMVYLAIIEPIREHRLLRWFRGRTEADMYLWVSEHRYLLEKSQGQSVSPYAAVVDLVFKKDPRTIRPKNARKPRAFDHYIDRLFSDILVPFNGQPESWRALEQAALVARKEKASLRGLHVMPGGDVDGFEASELKSRFNKFCEQANAGEHLTDELTVVTGKVPSQICRHALLTDLVVINVAHPPQDGPASIGSGLRAIIWRANRPVLTVREKLSSMDRALLIFNGNLKSKEALFVAAYLVQNWKISLTVLTVVDGDKVFPTTQDYARSYLASYDLQANFIIKEGPLDIFLDVIKENKINLILIGGYNGTALKEVMLGSAVNFLLREADCPMLICR